MPFNDTPSTWLGAGYSLASSEVKMTTATSGGTVLLSKLTDAEANATTGDIRQILWSMCYMMYEKWSAVTPANRPTKMTLAKSITANPDLTTQNEVYTFSFTTDTDPSDVTAEP